MERVQIGLFYSSDLGKLLKFDKINLRKEIEEISFSDLKKKNLSLAYVMEEKMNLVQRQELEKETDYYPVLLAKKYNINPDNFKTLSWEDVIKSINLWSLKRNLEDLENLPKHILNLQRELKKDWAMGVCKLWSHLRRMLFPKSLTIYFSDVGSGKKNKLVKKKIHGEKDPKIVDLEEMDQKIIDLYKGYYKEEMDFFFKYEEKGFVVGVGFLFGCEFLFTAHLFQLTPLQQSLIKGHINGINLFYSSPLEIRA